MSLTNFPGGVTSFGVPLLGGMIPSNVGEYFFVDGSSGSSGNSGASADQALATVQAAVNAADANDVILVAPGTYAETVTIARGKGPLTIVGLGNLGDAAIAPTTAAAKGLVNSSDDVTLINMDIAGNTTAVAALQNSGSRLRLFGCKVEGVDTSGSAILLKPCTVAQHAAKTEGNCGDIKIVNTELCWSFNGIEFAATDFGTPTQVFMQDNLLHNLSSTQFLGTPGAFGIGSVRNLEVVGSTMDNMEDGTKPSDFVNINTAFDTGVFSNNRIAIATNAVADMKVGAKLLWVVNATEAGWSTARPA